MINFENSVAIDSLYVEISKSIEKIEKTLEKLKDVPKPKNLGSKHSLNVKWIKNFNLNSLY